MNQLENIPHELTMLEQWVVIEGDSKAPLNSNSGDPASTTNPNTWSSFEEAAHRVSVGDVENVGFVFHDNGYIGIDIDVGWDEDGLMTSQCADILSKCHSYTERSRSGRGFHIFLKGTLPFGGKNNKKGLEIYKNGRYFITTGDVFIYRQIEENQEAIDYVVKTYFQESAKESKSGGTKFDRIYNPSWELPTEGRFKLRPSYPKIPNGCRNISLTSLAGAMHTVGYNPEQIYDELCYANEVACEPPIEEEEIETIVASIMRYKR